jgi:prevent-host-death family protein
VRAGRLQVPEAVSPHAAVQQAFPATASLIRIRGWTIILVMKTMSLAAAKTRFSALVDEAVTTHEQITVTRNGEPAVVVLSVADFESLLETLAILQDPEDRAAFEQARREADEGDVIEEDEMAALMQERFGRGSAG